MPTTGTKRLSLKESVTLWAYLSIIMLAAQALNAWRLPNLRGIAVATIGSLLLVLIMPRISSWDPLEEIQGTFFQQFRTSLFRVMPLLPIYLILEAMSNAAKGDLTLRFIREQIGVLIVCALLFSLAIAWSVRRKPEIIPFDLNSPQQTEQPTNQS